MRKLEKDLQAYETAIDAGPSDYGRIDEIRVELSQLNRKIASIGGSKSRVYGERVQQLEEELRFYGESIVPALT